MRGALRFALLTLLFSSMLGVPWSCVVTGMLDTDPLFGAHAKVLCPHVCPDCRGPYVFRPSDKGHEVYCSDSAGSANNKWPSGGWRRVAAYDVPGQEALIGATMTVLCLPLGALLAAIAMLRRRRARSIAGVAAEPQARQ
jgi:hypothetical protein